MKINMKIEDKDIKRVVPPLRFPEFRGAEGWKITQLHKLAKRIARKNAHGTINRVFTNSASDGIVDQRDYFDKDIANQNNLEGYYVVEKGDYVYNPRISNIAPVGPLSKNRIGTGVMSPLYMVFRFDNKINDFYAQYFQSTNWHWYLKEVSNQGARFDRISITPNIFMDMPIPAPIISEQQKIADCLGSLDDLISAVTDKIEALKEYKKGLMQQLFPAEGKTTPALRFPEFQNAGEWKNTVLGEEVHYENGKAHENDIDEAGHYIVVNSKFISTDGEVVKYTNHPSCLADKGDILMVLSDVPNGRAIAKCFIVDCNTKYTVNQRICKLKSKQAVSLLLYYIINRNPFLLSFDDGIKQTNLKKDEVLNLQFRLPEDTKEQQTIADFLSSVDELISAQTDKLDQLKTHKKGLMQQLFPTLNE